MADLRRLVVVNWQAAQGSDAWVAKIEPGREEDTQIDAKQRVAEERAANARLGGDRAAEMAVLRTGTRRALSA
jgi:hypothetical protein